MAMKPPVSVICDVALPESVAAAETTTPVWVQVATAGKFDGYAGGEMSFTFDEKVFSAIVANFRKHPSYRAAAGGQGSSDVVAWDFHHASEMPATEGTIPFTGAPAQGWVQELEVRLDVNGIAQLWAYTRWLEPARTFIKNGQYKWASVSVVFDAVDPKTGENVGPVLTSIALTNQPFIEGMTPLAASRQAAAAQLRRYFGDMYLEPADSPEKAMEMIRGMLGMPETADAAAVAGELEKVKQWVMSGATPVGVDLDAIVGGLRTVLNLAALASTEEVLMETDKLFARLNSETGVGDESGVSQGAGVQPPPAQPPAPPAPTFSKETEMNILNALAEKLGVQPQEKAVLEAVDQLAELRAVNASAQGLDSSASTKVILKATLDDAGVRAKFGPLLKALGVEDPDAALDKVATLMQESEDLKVAAPELASLRTKVEVIEEAEAEEDVEEAMASLSVPKNSEHYDGIRLAVSHYRSTHSRDDFHKKYPKAEPGKSYLTRNLTTGKAEVVSQNPTPTQVAASRNGGGDNAIDVSGYPGANIMLKACNFVQCSVQGAEKWPWDKVHEHASALVRGKKVVDASAS